MVGMLATVISLTLMRNYIIIDIFDTRILRRKISFTIRNIKYYVQK